MCTPVFGVIKHFTFLTFLGLYRANGLHFGCLLYPLPSQCQRCGFQVLRVTSVYFAASKMQPLNSSCATVLSPIPLSLLLFFSVPSHFREISRGTKGKLLCLICLIQPEVYVIFTILIFNDYIFHLFIRLYSFTCFLQI